jgi:hypothetical protein
MISDALICGDIWKDGVDPFPSFKFNKLIKEEKI